MKVYKATDRNKWIADCGIVAGKRRRVYCDSKSTAEAIIRKAKVDQSEEGDKWLNIPPASRSELLEILSEVEQAGLSLKTIWEAYKAKPQPLPSVALSEAVRQCIEAKRLSGCRQKYLDTLAYFLPAFATGRESQPIAAVTTSDIEEILNTHENQWTRATWINRLNTLFSFARKRKWIQDNPLDAIDRMRIEHRSPAILSPKAAAILLRLCRRKCPEILAHVVIGLFCGVRPSEIESLTWANVNFETAQVTVIISKVRARRICPIPPNAITWLKLCINYPLQVNTVTLRRRKRRLKALMHAKGTQTADILRHSAASYLLAREQDAGRVAHWLGNSPGVLLTHYKALVTAEEAAEFFSILPKS
jgi:integrase